MQVSVHLSIFEVAFHRLKRVRLASAVALLSCGFLGACFETAPASIENHVQGGVRVETFARDLVYPWSLAFLPDGRMLVTEREGRLRIVSAEGVVSPPLDGVPAVVDVAYNGLLDVAVDPKFADNALIYLTYSEPRGDENATAIARARLTPEGLADLEVIFRQMPAYDFAAHNGSRLAFGPDGALYATMGDRNHAATAQCLDTHNGKIIRIAPDGTVPPLNPYADGAVGEPEIWAIGLRNSQGIAFQPGTGLLWAVDHGPTGGDELNIITRGGNYGWPLQTAGVYEADEKPSRALEAEAKAHPPQITAPLHTWTPSIAPSDLMFYTGDAFPDWRGDLFISGMNGKVLLRVRILEGRVTYTERLLENFKERLRDVRQGPDGRIYVLTDSDDGRILRLSPSR